MNILIAGSGMYVTGRNGTGSGTILSSLAELSRSQPVSVTVVSKSLTSVEGVTESVQRINQILGTHLTASFVAGDVTDDAWMAELHGKLSFAAAIVCLPDHLHFVCTANLLKLKIHCLVVKPFTPTLAEANELVRLQADAQVVGVVEFHKRYDETNLYIKRMIQSQSLGQLLYINVAYSQRISIPTSTFSSWVERTNIFQYLGVHYVDLIYFLTGFLPQKVMAIGMNGGLVGRGISAFDAMQVTISWKHPESSQVLISNHTTNWIDPDTTSALSDQGYSVVGTIGRIDCDQKNRGVELVNSEGIQQVNPYFSEYLPDPNGALRFSGYGHKSISQFIEDVGAFIDGAVTLDHLDAHRPSFLQSLISTSVVEAANKSIDSESEWILI